MQKLNELFEQATEISATHGSEWSSALCQGADDSQAHAIICESRDDIVISTHSSAKEASLLCDYLELCSPANILAIAKEVHELKQRAEAAESKLAELEKQKPDLISHLEHCSEIVSRWPDWKKKGADAAKFIQSLDEFEIGYLNGHTEACRNRPAPAVSLAGLVPDNDLERVFDFAKFVIKCVKREGEYSPLSSQEPDEISAILRNIEEAK